MIEEPEKLFKAVTFLRRNWDNPLIPIILVVVTVLVGGVFLAYNVDIFGMQSEISLAEVMLIWGFASCC